MGLLTRAELDAMVDLRADIVAICDRGRERQAIGILELPLPDPPSDGAEWIVAYRQWAKG